MSLSDSKFISESKLLPELIQDTDFLNNSEISKNAEKIINACRQNKKERTKLDAFLSEYGLDNQEGVALMCLAESILRIPDSKTRDLIISEKYQKEDGLNILIRLIVCLLMPQHGGFYLQVRL